MAEEDTLLEVTDEIANIRRLVGAAFMATQSLPRHEANPLGALLDLVEHRLAELVDRLNTMRETPDAAEVEAAVDQ
ncbi:MAG: hypothetical protein WBZ39_03500 [Methylovirgula sp.]